MSDECFVTFEAELVPEQHREGVRVRGEAEGAKLAS